MRVLRLVFSLCVTMLTPNALAWGAQGHRITGWVADGFLSTRTRIEINHLLEGASLADAATWMDEEKRHLGPSIAKWHYSNIEICGPYEARCPAGNCLHERLPQQLQILSDRGAPSEARKRALLMVIHLVGDLHQTCKLTALCSDSAVLL